MQGQKIPGFASATKNLSILTQKIVSKLSQIWSGMFIPHPYQIFLPIPNPGVKRAPDLGSRIRIRNTGRKWTVSVWLQWGRAGGDPGHRPTTARTVITNCKTYTFSSQAPVQCCGSGSSWIPNFMARSDPDSDRRNRSVSAPDPRQNTTFLT